MSKAIIETLEYGGDYYVPCTETWYCIAVEKGKPKIIGSYTQFAVLQHPDFKEKASALIWSNYLNEQSNHEN